MNSLKNSGLASRPSPREEPHDAMAIKTAHSAKSDIGLKRTRNEDCFLADPALGLYVVCDGMGGSNAGDVASRLAIDTILEYLRSAIQDTILSDRSSYDANISVAGNQLIGAIRAANDAIHHASWSNPRCAGMGTTVVAARLDGQTLSVTHVGDSRLYLVRQGLIQALTTDHSWVAEQVEQGRMTVEEAERSPKRNIVTRALGVESEVDVDVLEVPVQDKDLLLLCSDGLTRGVHSDKILHAVDAEDGLEERAGRLVSLANQTGGDDNVTVLLVAIRLEKPLPFWQRIRERWLLKAS